MVLCTTFKNKITLRFIFGFQKVEKIDRLGDLYSNVLRRMDMAFEGYLAQDNNFIEPDDIPKTNDPVWILGRRYNAVQGK